MCRSRRASSSLTPHMRTACHCTCARALVCCGAISTSHVASYNVTPTETVSLSEFERFGEDRLKVLQAIDGAKSTGQTGALLK